MSYAAAEPTDASCVNFDAEDIRIAYRLSQDVAARFATSAHDLPAAQLAAQRAIDAYHPRDTAEMIHATRLVSLSMTQLDFLRAASQPDMDPLIKLRLVNYALRLEKAVVSSDRLLRLHQRPVKAAAEKPAPAASVEADPPAPADLVPQEAPPPPADAPAEAAARPSRPAMTLREAQPGAPQAYPEAEGAHEMMAIGLTRFLAAQEALMGQPLMAPPDGGGG